MSSDCGPIFIVEDDAHARESLRMLLEAAGYADTVEVETGEEALVLADGEKPSLVLLDVFLPGISGYEVCHQLRSRFGVRLPIIFVSGTRTEPHDRVAGLLVGADDYLVKPFVPGELVARVRRLLLRNGAHPGRNAAETQPLARRSDATDEVTEARPASRLSCRELDVLRLLAEGFSQQAIANQLFISPKTVATHIRHILAKLGVHSRAQAIAVAYREGLVEADFEVHGLT